METAGRRRCRGWCFFALRARAEVQIAGLQPHVGNGLDCAYCREARGLIRGSTHGLAASIGNLDSAAPASAFRRFWSLSTIALSCFPRAWRLPGALLPFAAALPPCLESPCDHRRQQGCDRLLANGQRYLREPVGAQVYRVWPSSPTRKAGPAKPRVQVLNRIDMSLCAHRVTMARR